MKLYLTYLLLVCASIALAQAPKPVPKPDPKPAVAKPETLPAIPDKDKLAIRDLQVENMQLSEQMKDMVTKYQQLQQQSQTVSGKIGELVNRVFKEANLDQSKYQIDPQKLVFVPKPPPATVSGKK